jgi:hypothetical protein
MADEKSKSKSGDQLTPIRTKIGKNDGNEMESLFGAPPLIPGDDPVAYNNLLAGVTHTLNPTEIIGNFLSRKFTDGMWVLRRLQLVQTTLLKEIAGGTVHLEGGDQARAVTAALTENIELFERLDRQIAGREHELREMYRMAERHKGNLEALFKRTPEQVEDAEFSEVDDSSGDGQSGGEQSADHE